MKLSELIKLSEGLESPAKTTVYLYDKNTTYNDNILGVFSKIEGNWNSYRYVCSKKVNADLGFNVIFDTNEKDLEKIKKHLITFLKKIEDYKKHIYDAFLEFYDDLLYNHTIYNGQNTQGFDFGEDLVEIQQELTIKNYNDFVNKIRSIDLVVEEYKASFLYYFYIYIWDGEYYFEERLNDALLFVFKDKECIYKGFDVENTEDSITNMFEGSKIIRQIENYLYQMDTTKLNKDLLKKYNMLVFSRNYSDIPFSYVEDKLEFKNREENLKENKNIVSLEEVGLEKFIDLLVGKNTFLKWIDKVIIIEENERLLIVEKEKYTADTIIYKNFTYSPIAETEICVSIITKVELDKNLLKDIIVKSLELYEKNNELIINEITDYYINRYFDAKNFKNGLFNEDFLEENYPIIIKDRDIKRLISIPNVYIEDIDNFKNNKFTILFETAFDQEYGLQIDIVDDKIDYIDIQY